MSKYRQQTLIHNHRLSIDRILQQRQSARKSALITAVIYYYSVENQAKNDVAGPLIITDVRITGHSSIITLTTNSALLLYQTRSKKLTPK